MPSIQQKVFALFSTKERRHIYLLFVFLLLSGLMEVLGIASIMPFLAVLASPEIIETDARLYWAYQFVGLESTHRFLFVLGGLVLALLLINNSVRALSTWLLYRFVWMSNYRLSRRLLEQYLGQPYAYFLNRNSAELSKNILAEVEAVVTGVLIPGMQVVAKGIIVGAIVAFLFFVDPVLSILVAVVLGGFYGGVYALIRRKLAQNGKVRIQSNEQRYRYAAEAFGGVKDVKLLGRERQFVNTYAVPSKNYGKARAFHVVIGQVPKNALEVVAFGGILVIVLYLLATLENFEAIIPLIGMYVFAGYRLMPSMQAVFAGVTNLRFNLPALDLLIAELQNQDWPQRTPLFAHDEAVVPLDFEQTIEFADVGFCYPGSDDWALQGIEMTLHANKTYALVGTTGCGKTTTVDILLGLLRPQQGSLCVDGVEITEGNLRNWQANLGYVAQDIYLCDQSIAENIAFGVPRELIDHDAVKKAARIAKIHDFIETELPQAYSTVVGERGVRLSGGQKQRIGIARALYHNPKVLILDEATSALDGVTENAIMDAIEELSGQKTIVMIAHRLSTVRECDAIFMLDRGKVIAQGTYEQLMDSHAGFRDMAVAAAG